MYDLLSSDEDELAATQGWGIHHVYENESTKWTIKILPAEAVHLLINRARQGDALALKALRFLVHGTNPKK